MLKTVPTMRIGLLAASLFLGFSLSSEARMLTASAPDLDMPGVSERAVETVADEIGSAIDNARLSAVPSSGVYATLTVKVAEYVGPSGISPEMEERVNASALQLTSVMQHRFGDRYRFVSDMSRDALIDDILADIHDQAERDRVLARIEANNRPDILIRAALMGSGAQKQLVYQAISVGTAEILGTTSPITLYDQTETVTASDRRAPVALIGSDGVFRPVALEAERLLSERGYDPGLIDGYIDDDLRASLRLYQADSALDVNGRLTWETVENLRLDQRWAR